MRLATARAALAAVCTFALVGSATAQEKIELKLAYYIGDQHPMSQWLVRWGEQMERGSNGRITVKRFPGSMMGPANQHYDMARTGQADAVWFFHGGTPGRFPLTEIINMPFMVGSGEIGTKVLNDPELRGKYLEAEHRGTRVLVLFTHQPGGLHTARKPVRNLDDLKGLRVRFPSPPIRDFLRALGAVPVGVPPTEVAEQLQKGVLDGAFTDYGGAGLALKLGGTVKFTTEFYSYVTSFGFVMNEGFYAKLPPDLQKLVNETTTGKEKEIGSLLDALDDVGKKVLADSGAQAIRLAPADEARVRKVGEEVSADHLKQLEAKGLPARATYDLMRSLAEKHAKTSRTFWK